MVRVLVVDGYIDEPACLGVPPYLSPQLRAIIGAARDVEAEINYLTIDDLRRGTSLPKADLGLVMAGAAVPGKYLMSLPASRREVKSIASKLTGLKILGGPAVLEPTFKAGDEFHYMAYRDPATLVYDLLNGRGPTDRWRTLDEWNRWLLLGADLVRNCSHFSQSLVAEVETYRGCVRYLSGGCSFCVEPLKGAPVFREEGDIIAECKKLRDLGVRNFRLGAQTCIISYKADLSAGDPPRPNPNALETLFSGVSDIGVDVLHIDNANPAVISSYPKESRTILRTLVRYCTSGNVIALGMESADPDVVKANNLNATPEQVMDAVKIINEEGRQVGSSGLPNLLPGINIIVGLDGETKKTLQLDLAFLKEVMRRNYLLRRLNIRQVIPIRREFSSSISHSCFIKFKEELRMEIDHPMLTYLVPWGQVLRRVYTEMYDGNTTFGRQIGSYPLLIGIPYPVKLNKFVDVLVIGWGYRSITAIEYPMRINFSSLKALEALPEIGRKRAIRLFHSRPISGLNDLIKALDDPAVAERLYTLVSFD